MELNNMNLNKIYDEYLTNLNNSFKDLDELLENAESFILTFDKRNLKNLQSLCYEVNFNPSLILKNFYFENIEKINTYFKNLLNIQDIYSKMNYDTGEFISYIKYNEKDIISIDILSKEFTHLIPIDKKIKIDKLKKDIFEIEKEIMLNENLLLNEKLIKEKYGLKKIKAFNKGTIKTVDEAKKDLELMIFNLKERKENYEEQINQISLSKDELQIKIEQLIKDLNSIDYNLILN